MHYLNGEQSGVMMTFSVMAALATAGQPLAAEPAQPKAQLLAQAHDRCMTTYAVRLTYTAATDEAIYSEAVSGCSAVKNELGAAISREYPADRAAELTALLEAQAKPNFLTLLQRIRTDRLGRVRN